MNLDERKKSRSCSGNLPPHDHVRLKLKDYYGTDEQTTLATEKSAVHCAPSKPFSTHILDLKKVPKVETWTDRIQSEQTNGVRNCSLREADKAAMENLSKLPTGKFKLTEQKLRQNDLKEGKPLFRMNCQISKTYVPFYSYQTNYHDKSYDNRFVNKDMCTNDKSNKQNKMTCFHKRSKWKEDCMKKNWRDKSVENCITCSGKLWSKLIKNKGQCLKCLAKRSESEQSQIHEFKAFTKDNPIALSLFKQK